MQVWTPQQLRAFLAHARHDHLYAPWLLVVTTGMRRAELAEAKSPKEALRCLKRRLSDAVYRCLLTDATLQQGGPTH
jgi:integrase